MYNLLKVYENLFNIYCDLCFLFLNGSLGGLLKILFDYNRHIGYKFGKFLYSIILSGITAVLIGIVYILYFKTTSSMECRNDLVLLIIVGFISGIFGVVIVEEMIYNVSYVIQKLFAISSERIFTVIKLIKKLWR